MCQVQKFLNENKECYRHWKIMYIDDEKESSAHQKGFMEMFDDTTNYSKTNSDFNLF